MKKIHLHFFETIKKFLFKRKMESEIDKQYEQAYGDSKVRKEFDREMKEWMEEQVWIE